MARPRKCRRVCRLPERTEFVPRGDAQAQPDAVESETLEPVLMTVDEYETIRLIDKEGFSQEECSRYMDVARTTVQQTYDVARKKIASAIVDGRGLRIEGGDYTLCGEDEQACMRCVCRQNRGKIEKLLRGGSKMKIAVTYENGQVFQHFGHTEQFKLYETEDGKVTAAEIVDTNGSGHGALGGFLKARGVDVLICGGIGGGAQNALAEAGIQLYGGVQGSADAAVEALLKGELAYNPDVKCDHHEHGEGHDCGSHGHGDHDCGSHGGHGHGERGCGGHGEGRCGR